MTSQKRVQQRERQEIEDQMEVNQHGHEGEMKDDEEEVISQIQSIRSAMLLLSERLDAIEEKQEEIKETVKNLDIRTRGLTRC